MPSQAELAFAITAKNEASGALSSLKGDIEGAAQSADHAGGIFSSLKEHLGGIAEVAGGLLGVQALGGLSGVFTGSIDKANELGQSIHELQTRIGGTAQDSSRLLFAFQEMGVQNPDMVITKFSKGLQGLEEQADGTTTKSNKLTTEIKGLGVAVEDASGKQRSMNDILGDVAEKFKTMPDGPEKTALAVQLFGKAGADMIPMLDQGREGMAKLSEESDKLGHTLTDKQLDAMHQNVLKSREFHAALEGLQIQLGVGLLPIMTAATGVLTTIASTVVEHVLPAVQGFSSAIGEHLGPVIKSDVIPAITQVWNLFTTLASGPIGMLISGIQMLISNWGEITKQFPALGEIVQKVMPELQKIGDFFSKELESAMSRIGPMFQQFGQIIQQNLAPILSQVFQWLGSHESVLMTIVGTAGIVGLVATIGAIPVAIAAISAAVVALVTHWGDITQAVGGFIDAVEKRFPEVGTFIAQVQNFFTGLWQFISQQFVPGVVAGIQAVVSFIEEHWAGISDLLSGPIQAAKDLIAGALAILKDVFSTTFTLIGDILNTFGDLFKGNWGKLWNDVKQIFSDVWTGIQKVIGDYLNTIVKLLGDAWSTIESVVRQVWNEIGGAIEGAISGIWDWIKSHWTDVLLDILLGPIYAFRDQIGAGIQAAVDHITGALSGAWDWIKEHWTDVLLDILLGPYWAFRDQIGEVLGAAKDAATGVLHDIWQWINDHFLQPVEDMLFSPFKSFASGIGEIMRSAGNALLEPLRGAIHGLDVFLGGIADAVDWISSKLGLGNIIPKGWPIPEIPQLAGGSPAFKGGLAIVGEEGPELVRLPAGTAILPAGPTKQLRDEGAIPGFFLGLDPGAVIDAMKGAWNGIKDFASEWINKGAEALFNSALSAVGFKDLSLPGVLQDMVPAIGSTIKDSVVSGVKELLGFAEKAKPAPTVVINGQPVQLPGSVADWLQQGAQLGLGRKLTDQETQALYWLIAQESGGDPNNVNPVAVNGEHATGILQTLPSTFAANAVPGHTNILNPVDNIAAALRYIMATYGDLTKPTANEQAGAPGYAGGVGDWFFPGDTDWMNTVLGPPYSDNVRMAPDGTLYQVNADGSFTAIGNVGDSGDGSIPYSAGGRTPQITLPGIADLVNTTTPSWRSSIPNGGGSPNMPITLPIDANGAVSVAGLTIPASWVPLLQPWLQFGTRDSLLKIISYGIENADPNAAAIAASMGLSLAAVPALNLPPGWGFDDINGPSFAPSSGSVAAPFAGSPAAATLAQQQAGIDAYINALNNAAYYAKYGGGRPSGGSGRVLPFFPGEIRGPDGMPVGTDVAGFGIAMANENLKGLGNEMGFGKIPGATGINTAGLALESGGGKVPGGWTGVIGVIQEAYDETAFWYQAMLRARAAAGQGGTTGMASGGLIDEPIAGIGRSGRRYLFGENGPERVTPGAGSGGDLHVHIHALDTNGVKQAIPELVRLINRHLIQIGQAPLVSGRSA